MSATPVDRSAWVQHATQCALCNAKFDVFTRKANCHRCGQLFCNNCLRVCTTSLTSPQTRMLCCRCDHDSNAHQEALKADLRNNSDGHSVHTCVGPINDDHSDGNIHTGTHDTSTMTNTQSHNALCNDTYDRSRDETHTLSMDINTPTATAASTSTSTIPAVATEDQLRTLADEVRQQSAKLRNENDNLLQLVANKELLLTLTQRELQSSDVQCGAMKQAAQEQQQRMTELEQRLNFLVESRELLRQQLWQYTHGDAAATATTPLNNDAEQNRERQVGELQTQVRDLQQELQTQRELQRQHRTDQEEKRQQELEKDEHRRCQQQQRQQEQEDEQRRQKEQHDRYEQHLVALDEARRRELLERDAELTRLPHVFDMQHDWLSACQQAATAERHARVRRLEEEQQRLRQVIHQAAEERAVMALMLSESDARVALMLEQQQALWSSLRTCGRMEDVDGGGGVAHETSRSLFRDATAPVPGAATNAGDIFDHDGHAASSIRRKGEQVNTSNTSATSPNGIGATRDILSPGKDTNSCDVAIKHDGQNGWTAAELDRRAQRIALQQAALTHVSQKIKIAAEALAQRRDALNAAESRLRQREEALLAPSPHPTLDDYTSAVGRVLLVTKQVAEQERKLNARERLIHEQEEQQRNRRHRCRDHGQQHSRSPARMHHRCHRHRVGGDVVDEERPHRVTRTRVSEERSVMDRDRGGGGDTRRSHPDRHGDDVHEEDGMGRGGTSREMKRHLESAARLLSSAMRRST